MTRKNIVVDFESYYDAEISVTTMGLTNYVAATEAYLVSVVSDGIEFCGSVGDLREHLPELLQGNPELEFWAANSNFDQALWEKYFPKTARPWKCILDRAACAQMPRHLAGVTKTVLGIELDKGIRDDMKGRPFESLSEERQQQVTEYCLQDSRVTWQLLQALPEMSPTEDAIAEHTRLCNRRGVRIDRVMVERDLEWLQRIRLDAVKLIPWVRDGGAPLSFAQFVLHCQRLGVTPPKNLDKSDGETAEWMKASPAAAEAVLAMRTFRGSNTKLEKVRTLLTQLTPDDRLPLELLYCGARHTRRWSSKGFNVQNLDKEAAFVTIMQAWPEFADKKAPGIFMRNYLIPDEGMKFGVVDFAQIEPRCLNWLAGNEALMQKIREGYGVYEADARASGLWSGDVPLKQGNPKLYASVKAQVLGLGYGMGADTYSEHSGVSNEPVQIGEDAQGEPIRGLSPAAKEVKEWRLRNKMVVDLWGAMEASIRNAACSKDKMLEVEMPSGDKLRHFAICSKGRSFQSCTSKGDFSAQSLQPRLWGGTLVENVTQRMARDVLAEAILRLEKNGITVTFHAHDEVITQLPIATADQSLEEVEALMRIAPDWCADLPLGVEGDVVDRYTKL